MFFFFPMEYVALSKWGCWKVFMQLIEFHSVSETSFFNPYLTHEGNKSPIIISYF